MTTFQFALHLDRELTEPEEDAIEAGVPEVHSLEGGHGSTEAHATVNAESFIDAVTAVVWKIEATGQRVIGLGLADLVTIEEIAARIGRDVASVRTLVADTGAGFPATSGPEEWGPYPWQAVADVDHRAQLARLLTA